jgi:hypothetical protein
VKFDADMLFLRCAIFYILRNWQWSDIYVYLTRHYSTNICDIRSGIWLSRLPYQHLSEETYASSFFTKCVFGDNQIVTAMWCLYIKGLDHLLLCGGVVSIVARWRSG